MNWVIRHVEDVGVVAKFLSALPRPVQFPFRSDLIGEICRPFVDDDGQVGQVLGRVTPRTIAICRLSSASTCHPDPPPPAGCVRGAKPRSGIVAEREALSNACSPLSPQWLR